MGHGRRLERRGWAAFFLAWASGPAAFGATIQSIDFQNAGGDSEIRIRADAPIAFEKQLNAAENQLVLEFKGATLSPNASRKLDTSSFEGLVALVSPYQVEGSPDTSRVVIQLRKGADTGLSVNQEGNDVKVIVPIKGSAPASQAADPGGGGPGPAAPPEAASSGAPPTEASGPASGDALSQFEATQKTKRFTGRKVTMVVRDAELTDVFQLIGEASGFNVMISSEVKGKVTLNMVDVPWDQALEMILHTNQLGAERNGNVLRITTLASLTAEKQAELAAKQASDASAPRITRVFSINYASLSDLASILQKMTAPPQAQGAVAASSTIVQADNRTNSIIVRDTLENIEKMKKLVEILDTQTPQVLIEAKVVEATEQFSRTIGGSLGLGGTFNDAGFGTDGLQAFATLNGGNPLDTFVSTSGAASVFGTGSGIAGNSARGGGFGASIAFIPGTRLNAVLNIAENDSLVKVISSPKTVVLNKESASIIQGTPVLIPGTTFVAGVGTVPTTSVQSADLSLSVTPTVTNESSVLMTLSVTRGVPISLGGGNTGIGNRNINTKVLVDSGSTLVVGGIYTAQNSQAEGGFPLLRKIPILGWLFGSKEASTQRSELFIFITPRILNPREAGLTS